MRSDVPKSTYKCGGEETNKNMEKCIQPLNAARRPLIDVR